MKQFPKSMESKVLIASLRLLCLRSSSMRIKSPSKAVASTLSNEQLLKYNFCRLISPVIRKANLGNKTRGLPLMCRT